MTNEELTNQIMNLKGEIQELRFQLNRKIGAGSADIRGNLIGSTSTYSAGSVDQNAIGADAVGQSELKDEQVTVNVAVGQTQGTGTCTSGSTIIGWRPAGNVDQLVDDISVSGTTVTVTLASAATAQNNFVVILLKT